MANIKAAQKYIRKTERRTAVNRSQRSRLRTLNRNIELAPDEQKGEASVKFVAALDKAAKVGLIHQNYANRHKARVAKYIFTKAGGISS